MLSLPYKIALCLPGPTLDSTILHLRKNLFQREMDTIKTSYSLTVTRGKKMQTKNVSTSGNIHPALPVLRTLLHFTQYLPAKCPRTLFPGYHHVYHIYFPQVSTMNGMWSYKQVHFWQPPWLSQWASFLSLRCNNRHPELRKERLSFAHSLWRVSP